MSKMEGRIQGMASVAVRVGSRLDQRDTGLDKS